MRKKKVKTALMNIILSKNEMHWVYNAGANGTSLTEGNLPVVHHSLPAQLTAKVIKSLFPVKYHEWIRRKKTQ